MNTPTIGVLAALAVAVPPAVAETPFERASGQGMGGLEAERLRLGLDRKAILDVESAEVGEVGTADGAFALGYAREPLAVRPFEGAGRVSVIDHRLGGSLSGSVVLLPRLRLGVELPFVAYQAGAEAIDGIPGGGTLAIAGFGDARIQPKLSLLSRPSGLPLFVAVQAPMTVPTARPRSNAIGDGLATAAAELVVSGTAGPVRWAFNGGPRRRARSVLGTGVQGNELGLRAGASVGRPEDWGSFEATVNTALLLEQEAHHGNSPAEVLFGYGRNVGTWRLFGAFGAGLSDDGHGPDEGPGLGAPRFRAVAGVRWAPPEQLLAAPVVVDAPAPVVAEPAPAPVVEVPAPVVETPAPVPAPVVEAPPARPAPALTLPPSLFATGSARPAPELEAALRTFVAGLATHGEPWRLRVVGHTDSAGNAESNLDLSRRRAAAVAALLVKIGVPAGDVSSEGRGAADPVSSNDTAEGRASNRRVEILLEKPAVQP